MYNNLVNEIVKKGYKTEEIAHILANLLNCSEEIIENKLKHVGGIYIPRSNKDK